MQDAATQSLVIWRLMDGKPGHENQTLGLVRALERLAAERGMDAPRCIDMPLEDFSYTLWDWLFKRFRPGFLQPRPDFIIGAGHRTHWPMLCARRSFGGKTIALMSPSLPLSWFNTVVIPEHDNRSDRNVIVTRGVLNAMQPGEKQVGKTLVLVGGEGKHFAWDDAAVYQAVAQLAQTNDELIITDSRRTPKALRLRLQAEFATRYQPWESCPNGWLHAQLASAETAWVTEDSVSMIYESLSAGCRVGLIALSGGQGRLAQGIANIEADGLVVRWSLEEGQTLPALPARVVVLNEAGRVAKQLLEPSA
jgi:mitochondrial fission protein ELM1